MAAILMKVKILSMPITRNLNWLNINTQGGDDTININGGRHERLHVETGAGDDVGKFKRRNLHRHRSLSKWLHA
ncbi:hypothetical protein QM027_00310 [Campylobacter concisus]